MLKKQINHNTIEIARISRGYSQKELCEKIGIQQGSLSKYESGLLVPNSEIIESISKELNYPVHFFYEDIIIPPSFAIHYRKKKALSGIELQMLQYRLYIMKHIVKKLMKAVTIQNRMIHISPDEYGDPEHIAHIVRQKWGVPRGPIKNLVSLVESVGVVVLLVDSNNSDLDGEVVPDEDGQPIIYLNKNRSVDRLRFTLAHELGHLIMHTSDYIVPGEIAEQEANIFAAEFLMPSEDIRYQIDEDINIARLADLKRHWKVSMAALAMTARRIGAINDSKFKSLMIQLSQKGYRKKEPELGLPPESPTIVKQILDLYFDKLSYSIEDLEEIVPLQKVELKGMIDLYNNKTIRLSA